MHNENLKLIIAEGEGLTVEFKEKYTSKIDRDIVALANSRGGYILLGVSDDGKMTGEKLTNQMKAEISSLARNCDPHISITKVSQIGDVVAIEVPEGLERGATKQLPKGKPPFSFGKGPGAFGLQLRHPFACVALLRRAPGSLFRSKIGPASAGINYAGFNKCQKRDIH